MLIKLLEIIVYLFIILSFHFLLLGPDNFCLIHVSLVPVLGVVGEQVRIYLFYTVQIVCINFMLCSLISSLVINFLSPFYDECSPHYLSVLKHRKRSLHNTVFENWEL